jgi:hypothetical protein
VPLSLAGWSTGARIRHGELRRDERDIPYLRFGAFGSSEVQLRLHSEDVEPLTRGPSPVLLLEHAAARRDVYPFHGLVFVDVILNGFVVHGRMAVPFHVRDPDLGRQEVRLPPDMFQPGANALTIRLHPDSMSTYRLFRAELRSQ